LPEAAIVDGVLFGSLKAPRQKVGGEDMLTRLMIVCGVIVLGLLCWNDFKQRILRPKSNFRYYTVLGLFLLVNLTIYLGLFLLILGKSPLTLFVYPSEESPQGDLGLFQPILIAILYFGAGAATFKFGNVEISLYRKMLDIFEGIFKISPTTYEEIRQTIYKTTAECESLECMISNFQTDPRFKSWDKLEHKWEDIRDDATMINNHIEELSSIHKDLQKPVSHTRLDEIKKDIEIKIKDSRQKVINKYKRYIYEFIVTNLKNEREIEKLLKNLFSIAPEEPPRQKANVVYRSLVFSFLFGLLIGPFLSIIGGSKKNLEASSWRWIFSLSVFGLLFSLIRKTKKGFQDLLNVIAIGALAGLLGSLAYMASSLGAEITADLQRVYSMLLRGVTFGAFSALVLYLFKWHVQSRISWLLAKYIGVGISGGLTFCLLSLLYFKNISLKGLGLIGSLGFVVLLAMAFALDLFSNEEGK
jgi:hypothetical protein